MTLTLSRSGGGIFPIVRAHAQGLAALPATTVTVYGLHDSATPNDVESWHPVAPLAYRPLIPRIGYAPQMSADLQRSAHDVVHQHGLWLYPSIAVARWRRTSGKPVVISTQGMLEPWAIANSALKKNVAGFLFERSNLMQAACIHCSEAEVEGIRAYGLRNPVAVIPNGIESPGHQARRTARPHWMSASPRRTLLFLGRLHPKKGIRELLRAWSRLNATMPALAGSWCLAIAGWNDDGYGAELQAMAAELGLAGSSVVFPGPVFGADKEAALSHADAFILPSFSEGFPIAVLEAWAHGLPVFMTRECNIPVGFEAGAAIEVTTEPEALAETLASSLSRTDLVEIGLKGRELVTLRFSWPPIVSDLRLVYEWLAGGGPRPSSVRLD